MCPHGTDSDKGLVHFTEDFLCVSGLLCVPHLISIPTFPQNFLTFLSISNHKPFKTSPLLIYPESKFLIG